MCNYKKLLSENLFPSSVPYSEKFNFRDIDGPKNSFSKKGDVEKFRKIRLRKFFPSPLPVLQVLRADGQLF
jgi:hypothetical protein